MINVLSAIVMILLLFPLWIMVRFDAWDNVMEDSEEEK